MSASARGIVVSADGLDLVLRATEADVARFAVGQPGTLFDGEAISQAVHHLRMQGFDMVPSRDRDHWRYFNSNDHPYAVAALLRTRCGCERIQPVPYPPSATFDVALIHTIRNDLDIAAMAFARRRFSRTGRIQERDGQRLVEYLEVEET